MNGQPCDELKGRRVNSRQTEVHFECCTDSFPSQQALPHLQELGSTSPSPDLYIRSFEELSICKYRMTVCMTALCSQQRLAQILAPKVTSLASILQSLRDSGTCLLLQESWWTYELCFHTDLRQYHASTQLMATTIPVAPASTPPSATTHLSLGEGIGAVIEAGERREVRVEVLVKEPSYVLGIAPSIPKSSSSSSSPSGTDNDVEKDLQTFIRPIPLFKKSTGSGSSSSPSSLSSGMGLLLQFKEGTLCDASSSQSSSGSPAAKVAGNKVRSTDVYLTCAAK